MKHYILKKDLPTFKAGDKFHINSNGNLILDNSWIVAYAKSTLEKFPNILKDWFEEIPREYKRWRAEKGEGYWYINDCGAIKHYHDYGDIVDSFRYATGNYFKTEAETEAYKNYIIARQILLDDARGGKWKKDGTNLYAYYDYDISEWVFDDDIDNV